MFLALNLRLMALALTRIRRIHDPTVRLHLAALAAPLFGLVAAGFAGVTTASVPPAPYFWFVAGVLSYWLVTRLRSPSDLAQEPHGGTLVARADEVRPRPHVLGKV
jgi:hypothetical protein